MSQRRDGFSLIELLVVLGVIGVLTSLTLPAVQSARASASRAGCQNDLKQIGLALNSFHGTHGRLPPLPVKGTVGTGFFPHIVGCIRVNTRCAAIGCD